MSDETQDREAFERYEMSLRGQGWAKDYFELGLDGYYKFSRLRDDWKLWQAALAYRDRELRKLRQALNEGVDLVLDVARDRLRSALKECYIDLAALLNATTWELAPAVREQLQKSHDIAKDALKAERG